MPRKDGRTVMSSRPRVRGGKETGVDLTLVDKRTGEVSKKTLLNPHGKGAKYATELKRGVHMTNTGVVKTDKYGKSLHLNKQQRAYRSGYLQAQHDSAKAYKAGRKKV